MVISILCGGSGTRLWPISRASMPKQFAKLLGKDSLFTRTLERNAKLLKDTDSLQVITNDKHYFLTLDEVQEAQITVKTYTITSTNDIDQVSATMASEVQAVYVPSDNTVASGFSTLVKNTNAKNIPIFPGVDSMIKGGGVATVSVSQYELGKLTGKMAAHELRGKNPAPMPVETVKKGSTVINQKQADKLGLKVPASAIKQANEKGEIIK